MAQNLHNLTYNPVERLDSQLKHSKCGHSRRKNNSFSSSLTPEKSFVNALNYYSDNASSYVQSGAKKSKARRSLSSSPTLHAHYAGAKFSEPPSPSVLPLPPTHWTEFLEFVDPAEDTPISLCVTPTNHTDLENIMDSSCSSTPSSSDFCTFDCPTAMSDVDQSVEIFFQKCSFTQLETCRDFTKQLKTLLNVPA